MSLPIITLGLVHEVPSMDPQLAFTHAARLIARQVFDAPFFPGAEGATGPVPCVFTTFRDLGHGQTFEATCRNDLRFSDGAPVTAEDVAEALRTQANVARVDVRGNTLTMSLRGANTRFELSLASGPLLARRSANGVLGSGRFRVKSWSRDAAELEPNPAHPDGARVTLRVKSFAQEPQALAAAVNDGSIDLALLSWADIPKLGRVSKITRPVNATGLVFLNTETLPDVELRREVAGLIDPGELTRAGFGEGGLEALGLLPPGFGHSPMLRMQRSRSTTTRTGRRLRLLHIFASRSYLPSPDRAADVLARQLEAGGFTVERLVERTMDGYMKRVAHGDYDLLLAGNNADSDDPVEFLEQLLSSQSICKPNAFHGAYNFSRVKDPRLDLALAQYRHGRTSEQLSAINELVREQAVLVPCTHGRLVIAHSWRLKNVQASMAGLIDFAALRISNAPT